MYHFPVTVGAAGIAVLIFKTNNRRQCYKISVNIARDEVCDDFSMENLVPSLTVFEGVGDISIMPSSTQVTIVDSEEARCGMYFVEICILSIPLICIYMPNGSVRWQLGVYRLYTSV